MAELKLPRLLAAAKEFNIGKETLIDFLEGKGFAKKGELKDQTKLTEDMYRSAMQEFSSDKAAKMKSDQLELPKGTAAEARKKKEDEDIGFGKVEKPAAKVAKKEEEVKPAEPEVVEEKPVKGKTKKRLQQKQQLSRKKKKL
jgi:translation initiation factor IF-2